MTSISTHALSATAPRATLTVSVDPRSVDPDNVGKNGYWKLVVTSFTWTGGGLSSTINFTLDARAGLFNKQNDLPIADNVSVVSSLGAYTPSPNTQILSYNYGQVGPSAMPQGDGTFDMLKVTVDLGYTTITNFVFTVNYTLTFVEITDTTVNALTSDSVALTVNNDQTQDMATISMAYSSGAYGVYVLSAQSLVTDLYDNSDIDDSVPSFAVVTAPTPNAWGNGRTLVNHPISKSSTHTKTYVQKAGLCVFAVNNGFIDSNGQRAKVKIGATLNTVNVLGNAALARTDDMITDDTVYATFNYKYGFITA